jgi:hypothetical protein
MRHLRRCRLRTNVGQRLQPAGWQLCARAAPKRLHSLGFAADPLRQPPDAPGRSTFPPEHRTPSAGPGPLCRPAMAMLGHSGRIQSP